MSDGIETFLVKLERDVRRLAGRHQAEQVVAELRAHCDDSVAELMAAGQSREAAMAQTLARLGQPSPRDFVPRDGAPSWLDRSRRSQWVFWLFLAWGVAPIWLIYGDADRVVPIVVGLAVTGLGAFGLLGAYGARFVAWPLVRAVIVWFAVNTFLMSVFWVDTRSGSGPFPQPRWVVERSVSLKDVTLREVKDIRSQQREAQSLLEYYRGLRRTGIDTMPSYGKLDHGLFRLPSPDDPASIRSTPDLSTARVQWLESGSNHVARLASWADSSRESIERYKIALDRPYAETLKAMVQANGTIVWLPFLFALTSALLGDMVWSVWLKLRWRWSRSSA